MEYDTGLVVRSSFAAEGPLSSLPLAEVKPPTSIRTLALKPTSTKRSTGATMTAISPCSLLEYLRVGKSVRVPCDEWRRPKALFHTPLNSENMPICILKTIRTRPSAILSYRTSSIPVPHQCFPPPVVFHTSHTSACPAPEVDLGTAQVRNGDWDLLPPRAGRHLEAVLGDLAPPHAMASALALGTQVLQETIGVRLRREAWGRISVGGTNSDGGLEEGRVALGE